MNPPLTYLPAYLGLFVSLLLGVTCNSFLDIQYGSFGVEVIIAAILFGWTLKIGWQQHGEADETAAQKQKIVLLLGAVFSVLVFIPMWGFPRAGLYMLAVLQAAQNCITTTRRHLYFGLLVSAVMVMFAASHYRADWTMLFYLIPYIIAVVFTLVSEQISRRAQSIRQTSLGNPGHTGQGIAIAAATAIILGLGGILYLATPQVTWPYISWRYGQLTNIGLLGNAEGESPSSQSSSGNSGEAGSSGSGTGQDQENGEGGMSLPGQGWPTPAQMRDAAKRPGMPAWQSGTIMQMANMSEAIGEALAPIKTAIEDLWKQFKEWLEKNRNVVLASLIAALLLVILAVLVLLLREAKAGIWLRSRYDYWRLVKLGKYQAGTPGAIQFYRAMERLFVTLETPREPTANTQEFLREATYYRDHIRQETSELTRLFEQFRYGPVEPDDQQLERMRQLYRVIFQKLANSPG